MSNEMCVERVWTDRGGTHQCSRKASITRDGKGYCRQHDPEAAKARRAARMSAYAEKRQADNAVRQMAERRASQLGGGAPHYTHGYSAYTGYTGGVDLSPAQADRLIERLQKLENLRAAAWSGHAVHREWAEDGDIVSCLTCSALALLGDG